MTLKRSQHDEFVKAMMAHPKVATDFFKAHLPSSILEKIDLTTLKMEPTSFIDEQLKKHESDLIYSVKLINQQEAILYALVEHQSKPDSLMPFRLQYYLMQGLKRYIMQNKKSPLPLPLVFPVVLYNGDEPYPFSRDIFSLFGDMAAMAKQVFLEPFTLVDVATLPDDNIRKHQWAGIMELSLCRAHVRDFSEEMRQLGLIFRDIRIEAGDEIVELVLKYDMIKHDYHEMNPENYKQAMVELLPSELETVAMNIAQAFIEKGKHQGLAEGVAQGEMNTRRAIEMIKKGSSIESIIEATGISKEMLEFLEKNIPH